VRAWGKNVPGESEARRAGTIVPPLRGSLRYGPVVHALTDVAITWRAFGALDRMRKSKIIMRLEDGSFLT
jgi:hypothetical protein